MATQKAAPRPGARPAQAAAAAPAPTPAPVTTPAPRQAAAPPATVTQQHVGSARHRSAPRTAPKYDSKAHGGLGSRVPAGNYCLNTALTPVRLEMPSFKDGPTWFRPFPFLSYESPADTLQPGRTRAEAGCYTHWFIRCTCAPYVGIDGCVKTTFILNTPGEDDDQKSVNPYRVFYWACKNAFDGKGFGNNQVWDGRWNPLMQGTQKAGAAIKKPNGIFFIQGAVYVNGKNKYIDAKRHVPLGMDVSDDLVVLQLPVSVGIGLSEVLDRTKKEYNGDPETDFSAPFVYGDPVGTFDPATGTVKGGLFMTAFNPKVTNNQSNTSWRPDVEKVNQGYEFGIARTLSVSGQKFVPDLDAATTDLVLSRVRFWFDDPDNPKEKGLLRIAPNEQQALWVAQAFKKVPQLVAWAWCENPEFLTAEVKGVLSQRVTAVVPAASAAPVAFDEVVAGDDLPADVGVAPAGRTRKTDPVVAGAVSADHNEFADAAVDADATVDVDAAPADDIVADLEAGAELGEGGDDDLPADVGGDLDDLPPDVAPLEDVPWEPIEGDRVAFVYREKRYEGTIVGFSDDLKLARIDVGRAQPSAIAIHELELVFAATPAGDAAEEDAALADASADLDNPAGSALAETGDLFAHLDAALETSPPEARAAASTAAAETAKGRSAKRSPPAVAPPAPPVTKPAAAVKPAVKPPATKPATKAVAPTPPASKGGKATRK